MTFAASGRAAAPSSFIASLFRPLVRPLVRPLAATRAPATLLAAAGLLALRAPVVVADEPATSHDLGTVEVIGKREPVALPLTVDVADAAQLAAEHRDDLAEALDLIPGIAIQNTGQRRERLIALRGFSSRQVPLFIDGVPVYVPYDGNVDLARFGVDYVSSISVSKGLASLLYGPNILGGAVNVISRRPTAPLEITARVAGEFDDHLDSNLFRASGSVGGRSDRWYAYVSASGETSNGYRLPDSFVPTAAENGGRRENAGSRDNVVLARLGLTPDGDDEYALNFYRQQGEKQDPPYAGTYLRTGTRTDGVTPRFWRWPWWDKESVSLTSRNAIGASGTLRLRAFFDKFQNSLESYDDASYTTQVKPYAFVGSRYDDYSVGGAADFEWRWTDNVVTRLASHYKRDVHREQETTPYEPQERLDIPTYDFAIEQEWRLTPQLSLTPSYQHVVQSGRTVQVYTANRFSPVAVDQSTADNGQLVGTWALDDSQSLVAGVSRKTRFPTIKERFSGGLGSAVPNPALSPEYATHYEVGYERRGTVWNGKVSVFQADLHDAIQAITLASTACSSPPCTQLRNIGQQRNRGFELSGDYTPLESLTLSGQLNHVDIDNISNPTVQPTGTPRLTLRFAADWSFLPQWRLRVDTDHESDRVSNSTGTRIAGAFTLVNSFVRYTPSTHWGFEFGGRNLTDRLYAYEEGYYEPGRTWLLQADWRY